MPSHVLLIIVNFILLINLILKVLQEKGVRHDHIAFWLRALSHHAPWSLRLNLILQELAPAKAIVLVTTFKTVSLTPFFVLKLTEANPTHIWVLASQRVIHLWELFPNIVVILQPNFKSKCVRVRKPFLDPVVAPLKIPINGKQLVFRL